MALLINDLPAIFRFDKGYSSSTLFVIDKSRHIAFIAFISLKYDANNIYLASMYSETRNMTPYGDSNGVANKTQNFEVTAQYQFDFGLRPAISYLQSKGKDLGATKHDTAYQGDKDLVKYMDIGATYYFNKNMSTYVDYKINLLDGNDSFYANNGISTDNIVAMGLVYQF